MRIFRVSRFFFQYTFDRLEKKKKKTITGYHCGLTSLFRITSYNKKQKKQIKMKLQILYQSDQTI